MKGKHTAAMISMCLAGAIAAQGEGMWKYDLTLYFLGASMDGLAVVQSIPASVDIVSNLELGTMVNYCALDMDYKEGDGDSRFKYDMTTHGPTAGVTWKY